MQMNISHRVTGHAHWRITAWRRRTYEAALAGAIKSAPGIPCTAMAHGRLSMPNKAPSQLDGAMPKVGDGEGQLSGMEWDGVIEGKGAGVVRHCGK
jgi:hypothetical protein